MRNKVVLTAFTGILPILVAMEVPVDVFSRTFNPDYPMYEFNLMGIKNPRPPPYSSKRRTSPRSGTLLS
jgi:hypothetical protein